MRLISQDGGIDLPYENVILESMDDCKCIFAHAGTAQPYRMAEYSSVEKMDKAMEMVRSKYGEYLYGKGGSMATANFYVPAFAFTPPKAFQFPDDDEVNDE